MSPNRRRNSERTGQLDLPASVVPPGGEVAEVAVVNLGPDGAYLRGAARIAQGDCVCVRFQLENHPLPFELEAEVRWERGAEGFGVQFIHSCDYDRAALTDFCQLRLDDQRRSRFLNQG